MENLPENNKLLKVTLEYVDGSKYSIENKMLKTWTEFNLQVASFCTLHRTNPDWQSVLWKRTNSKKESLAQVFNDTKSVCEYGKLTEPITKKITSWDALVDDDAPENEIEIEVVNMDCVNLAIKAQEEGGKVCILNMANAVNRGGGVENGSMAQEEELCRRSNLWYGLDKLFYPFGEKGFVFSKSIEFFKNEKYKVSDSTYFDVISVAAPNIREKKPKNYEELVEEKVKQILFYPQEEGCDTLILSAFGCGAFKNNPEYISEVFKRQLKSKGLKYKKVYFGILDDANAKANGFSNLNVFTNTFKK